MFSAREAPCIVVVCLTILARWLLLGNDGAVSRGAAIEIIVRTLTRKLRVQGTVQVVHPGFGMGVKFTLKTAEQREQVEHLVACQVSEEDIRV